MANAARSVAGADQLQLAMQVAVDLASSAAPDEVVERLLRRAVEVVEADRATLFSVEGDEVVAEGSFDSAGGESHSGPRYPVTDERFARVISLQAPFIGSYDLENLPPEYPELARSVRHALTVPLVVGGEVVACLALIRRRDHPFEPADVGVIQQLGNVAVMTLRHTRLLAESLAARQQAASAADRHRLVADLALDLAGRVDSAHVLRRILQRASLAIDAQRTTFSRIEGDQLVVVASFAVAGLEPAAGARYSLARLPVVRRAAATRRPVAVSRGDRDFPKSEVMAGFDHTIAVPVAVSEADVAVVGASRSGAPFTSEDVATYQQIATVAALALRNAQLDGELDRRVRDLELLIEAAIALGGKLALPDVLAELARLASLIPRESDHRPRRGTVLRIEDQVATIAHRYGPTKAASAGASFPLAEHQDLARVVATLAPHQWRCAGPPGGRGSGAHSARFARSAAVPVVAGGDLFGILQVCSRIDQPFSASDLRLLAGLAHLGGLAIGNSERFRLQEQRAEAATSHGARLAQLEEMKSEILRLASHELRAPLTVLRGYVSMLDDGSLETVEGPAREVLPILMGKVEEMDRLISEMLETARLEEGRLELDRRRFDLRRVCEETVGSARSLGRGSHSLTLEVPADPVWCEGDFGRIRSVIANILDNAIKYSPAGGRVVCRLRRQDDRALIEVSDEGLGIARDDLSRLFTRFGRLITLENSHISGTGLGLYLARELARLHGGDIAVTSRLGAGSTFTIELPATA